MKPTKAMYPDCHINPRAQTFLGPDGVLRPCCYVNNVRHWRQFTDWCEANQLNWREDLDITQGIDRVANSETWNRLHQLLDQLHNTYLTDTTSVEHLAPKPCWEMCSGKYRRVNHKTR